MDSLIKAQEAACVYQKGMWMKREYQTLDPPHKGLWRGPKDHFVAPLSLLRTLIEITLGEDHCARGEMIRKGQQAWWSLYLTAMVDTFLVQC